ncbi:hypothetical protein ACQ4LE_000420 [Meloidogyne hapla]|uniref:BTB domain-containing protein n=1 Tax=Meloidogyne hapla TaxID=6305 RepID=A0A1I8B709_MELHA
MSTHINVNESEFTITFEWKLKHMAKYAEKKQCDEFFTSKKFCSQRFPSILWEMRVYPNGCHRWSNVATVSQGAYVSLFAVKNPQTTKFCIYALDAKGVRVDISSRNEELDFRKYAESSKFSMNNIKRAELLEGSLLLYCEIEFLPSNLKREHDEIDVDYSPANKSQNLLIKMFRLGTLADCVIKIDNQKINVHRCVMAQNSKVFHRMLEQKGMVEAQKGEINIVDSSFECFNAMLEYFYSGEINKNILEKFAEELFILADKYEVLQLREICERFISLKINSTNFAKRIRYAQTHGLPQVEKACVNYISTNKKTFLVSNEWKEFKLNNKDMANKLLEYVALDS